MPCGATVETNGLKSWVMALSGELSITNVCDLLVAGEPGLDEHAPSPAARMAAAATVMSLLGFSGLPVIFVFPVVGRVWQAPLGARGSQPVMSPPPCRPARSSGAATSRRQHAASRRAETRCRAGLSRRQRSSASGHRGLNGQPCADDLACPDRRPFLAAPSRSALPRLSGSGAEATSSWV